MALDIAMSTTRYSTKKLEKKVLFLVDKLAKDVIIIV